MTETVHFQQASVAADGAHAFDPYFGSWRLQVRKLRDVLDPDCEEWIEFEGTNEVRPIFGGNGNVELACFPGEPRFEGLNVRLFDPQAGLWRVWWASTRQPGEMGPPAEGRFTAGSGLFESDEVLAGRQVKVRFEWTGLADGAPHWEQSFSYDGGQTWKVNWITVSTRLPE
jgi:hypothetical protein